MSVNDALHNAAEYATDWITYTAFAPFSAYQWYNDMVRESPWDQPHYDADTYGH